MRWEQNLFFGTCFLFALSLAIRCGTNEKPPVKEEKDSVAAESKTEPVIVKETATIPDVPFEITYHYLPLDSVLITTLKQKFTEEELDIILAANRIDFEHVRKADTLVVPYTFLMYLNSYSPFPDSIDVAKPLTKLILISYPVQAFAVYEKGSLLRWGPTSMGKRSTPTPTGLFHANWKGKQIVSTDNPEWILNWCVNLDNKRGVSLHQYDLPGFPASHACMRLYEKDARWLYEYADQWILKDDYLIAAYGTPVVIFGNYEFGKRKPWLALPENSRAVMHTEQELEDELEQYLPVILQRTITRDSVAAARQIPVG